MATSFSVALLLICSVLIGSTSQTYVRLSRSDPRSVISSFTRNWRTQMSKADAVKRIANDDYDPYEVYGDYDPYKRPLEVAYLFELASPKEEGHFLEKKDMENWKYGNFGKDSSSDMEKDMVLPWRYWRSSPPSYW